MECAEVKLLGFDSTRWLLWVLEALAPRVLIPQQGDHIYDLIVPSIYRPFCPKANTTARVGLSVYKAWLDPKGETRLIYHWTRAVDRHRHVETLPRR